MWAREKTNRQDALRTFVLKSLILVALNQDARIKAAEKRAGSKRGQIFHLAKLDAASSRSWKMMCTGCTYVHICTHVHWVQVADVTCAAFDKQPLPSDCHVEQNADTF